MRRVMIIMILNFMFIFSLLFCVFVHLSSSGKGKRKNGEGERKNTTMRSSLSLLFTCEKHILATIGFICFVKRSFVLTGGAARFSCSEAGPCIATGAW